MSVGFQQPPFAVGLFHVEHFLAKGVAHPFRGETVCSEATLSALRVACSRVPMCYRRVPCGTLSTEPSVWLPECLALGFNPLPKVFHVEHFTDTCSELAFCCRTSTLLVSGWCHSERSEESWLGPCMPRPDEYSHSTSLILAIAAALFPEMS